jgi:hypothetical protein
MQKKLLTDYKDPYFTKNCLNDKTCLITKDLMHKLLSPNSVKAPDGVYIFRLNKLLDKNKKIVFVYNSCYYTHHYTDLVI